MNRFLAVLLAAALTVNIVMANDLPKVLTAIGIFTLLKDASASAKSNSKAKAQEAPATPATRVNPLVNRRLIIDSQDLVFETDTDVSDNSGYGYGSGYDCGTGYNYAYGFSSERHRDWLKENLVATLRERCFRQGLDISLGNEEFNTNNQYIDRVNKSGRYSLQSAAQVPSGQQIAPTDWVKVTGFATVQYQDKSGIVAGDKVIGALSWVNVKAVVVITVEPIDIKTGLRSSIVKVRGEAVRMAKLSVASITSSGIVVLNQLDSNLESELLNQAATDAADQAAGKLSFPSTEVTLDPPPAPRPLSDSEMAATTAPTPVVVSEIPSTPTPAPVYRLIPLTLKPANKYPLVAGDQLDFFRQGRLIGTYTIYKVNGVSILIMVPEKDNFSPQNGDHYQRAPK